MFTTLCELFSPAFRAPVFSRALAIARPKELGHPMFGAWVEAKTKDRVRE
jgi:hypothetical protein